MNNSKAIKLIKVSKNPEMSVIGIMMKKPTPAQLKKNIPNETQRIIWGYTFDELYILNRAFIGHMPLLLSYSKEMAMYQILSESAGDKITDNYRGDDRINPELTQANRSLRNAMDLYKLLGLDAISRHRIGIGPKPLEENKNEFEI